MNYTRIYQQLVARAKDRELLTEFESHHIVPRCIGGNNNVDNLVDLTPEEHFVAHILLVKIHPKNYKLIFAANNMCRGHKGKRPNRKLYGWLRRRFIRAAKENQQGKKNSQFGKMWITNGLQNKTILKIDIIPEGWKKGRTGVPSSRKGIAIGKRPDDWVNPKKGIKTGKRLDNWISPLKGIPRSEEQKKNYRKPKGPQRLVTCPYCLKEGGISNMTRHHFDNCKMKIEQ